MSVVAGWHHQARHTTTDAHVTHVLPAHGTAGECVRWCGANNVVAVLQAMRLFVGDPVWTPINRCPETDAHPARTAYVQTVAAC